MDRAFPRPVAILFAAVVAVAIIAMFRSLPTGGDGGPRTATVVVVDAGHGGEDGGTVVFGLREKDLTLDLAHRLARALEVRGLRPVLTRTDDSTVPLEERVAAGARVRTTALTEAFSYAQYREQQRAEGRLPLFAVGPDGRVHVYSDKVDFTPGPGWKILALPKGGEDAGRRA